MARVSGHPETKPLPLAALAHLLPPDVARPTGPEGELERAALFHRARAAIEQMAGGSRAMMLVDDIDQLDDLSRALIVSLVHARAVFVAATLRTPDGVDDGLTLLVKDGHLHALDVGPLGADTVEALLHRVVGGPIEGDQPGAAGGGLDGQPGRAAPAGRIGLGRRQPGRPGRGLGARPGTRPRLARRWSCSSRSAWPAWNPRRARDGGAAGRGRRALAASCCPASSTTPCSRASSAGGCSTSSRWTGGPR